MTTKTYMYTCSKCGKVFEYGDVRMMCLVLHPPEDCCHYGETEIKNKEPADNLLPPLAMAEVERVLKHGADKFAPWDWLENNTNEEDLAASLRHLGAKQSDRETESGLYHLAHSICRQLFVLERKLRAEADHGDKKVN
jgi:predicted  nucleic acid-binding Zn-ribbon protein